MFEFGEDRGCDGGIDGEAGDAEDGRAVSAHLHELAGGGFGMGADEAAEGGAGGVGGERGAGVAGGGGQYKRWSRAQVGEFALDEPILVGAGGVREFEFEGEGRRDAGAGHERGISFA